MAKNIVSDNAPPYNIESKTQKMIDALILGEHVSRQNCHLFGISDKNDSIHSFASTLRNKKLIPLITVREGRGVASYYMDKYERQRYQDPIERENQKKEMKADIEKKRLDKMLKRLSFVLKLGSQSDQPWLYEDFLKKLAFLLAAKKGGNSVI